MCSTYKKFYAGLTITQLKCNNNIFPQTIEQLYRHGVYRQGRPGQARRFLYYEIVESNPFLLLPIINIKIKDLLQYRKFQSHTAGNSCAKRGGRSIY